MIIRVLLLVLTVVLLCLYSHHTFEALNSFEDIRLFNLFTESVTALVFAFFFLKSSELKGKPYHWFLSLGFYLAFVALAADSLDQLYLHNELYTAIVEKSLKLFGYGLVFIGVIKWLEEYNSLNQELSKQVISDNLTGLYNRRGMVQVLKGIHEKALKNKATYSVVVVDFDDFKVINDTFGHLVGDEVLRRMGQALLHFLKDGQKVGRWGGEEFAMVKYGSGAQETAKWCEAVRNHLNGIDLSDILSDHQVTMSFGLSEYDQDDSFLEVVRRADRALYQSKRAGKDCVTVL